MQPWIIPHIISYLSDAELSNIIKINHFWHQCVTESLSFPRITYNALNVNSQTIRTKCKPHQHRSSRILIVGDGNFSFTLSLCALLPPTHYCSICKISKRPRVIITSTLSSNATALAQDHPSALQNINHITTLYPFCQIRYGVDATDLEHTLFTDNDDHKCMLFDEIIWNFPHSNDHRHIATNRNLLKSFFKSSAKYLTHNGIITVRLCFGQGGTLKEEDTLKALIEKPHSKRIPLSLTVDPQYKDTKSIRLKYEGHETTHVIKKTKVIKLRNYSNSWKIVEMASYSGFILCHIAPFYWNVFHVLYYNQTGRRGNDKRFLMDLSLTHTFIRDDHTLNDGGCDVVHKFYPMTFVRDISFWLSEEWEEYMKQHTFEEFVYSKLDGDVVFKVEYLNEFVHEQTGKRSKTFRIWYKETRYAFNRFKCNELQSLLRDALRDELNVGVANNPNQQK
eukprot:50463_1